MYLTVLVLVVAYGILVPWPGIKPNAASIGSVDLSCWTTREVPNYLFLSSVQLVCFLVLCLSDHWSVSFNILLTLLSVFLFQLLCSNSTEILCSYTPLTSLWLLPSMIFTLNLLWDRVFISPAFSSFSKVISCSFIWRLLLCLLIFPNFLCLFLCVG